MSSCIITDKNTAFSCWTEKTAIPQRAFPLAGAKIVTLHGSFSLCIICLGTCHVPLDTVNVFKYKLVVFSRVI